MEKKSIYDVPEMKVIILGNTDVIATSSALFPDDDDGYSQYYPDPF